MELTRRDFLKGAAATGLAALLPISCATKEPYTLEFTNIEYKKEGRRHIYYHTRAFTNNTDSDITLTKGILYFKNSGTLLSEDCKYKIKAGQKLTLLNKQFWTTRSSEDITSTYTGKNNHGKLIEISQSISVVKSQIK